MATFISLINWTDQGIRNFGDSVKRAEAFTEMVQGLGGSVNGLWWTVGPYDIVAVFEAPDIETATAAALKVGAIGNVRTTTPPPFRRRNHARCGSAPAGANRPGTRGHRRAGAPSVLVAGLGHIQRRSRRCRWVGGWGWLTS